MAEAESSVADESLAQSEAQDEQQTHNMTVGIRRQANGTIGSVYSGNKIRHLKKEDGIPLWRKDIQYQFLKLVFEDKTPVFTRWPDGEKNLDFADIYIDAMARSSKTSKILKDKLQNDKQAAISMAMVCLLVNFGRMNTTLNFFPEMRAQLRTYHSIPSLQAHQDPNAYKQLQDAPRLKSILKGASEDHDQPNTLDRIKRHEIPRTNPVNLIFVLAQYAPKVSEMHFFPPRDFFDLVMRGTLSSRSRARAFLWLMWWYLESDFSAEAARNNPFGPGLDGEGTGGLPIKVPQFESLTEEQANEENVDTQSEVEYGEAKRLERKRILEDDEPLPRVPKRSKKGLPDLYDDEASGDMSGRGDGRLSTMSTPLHPSAKRHPLDDEDDYLTPGHSARSRSKRPKRESSLNRSLGQQRLILRTKMENTPDAASPAPPGSGHPILNRFVTESAQPTSARRPRPLTQHQLAVEQNRRQRIEYILAKRKSEAYRVLRAKRESEIPIVRYGRRLSNLPEGYDTDDEEKAWGKGGLVPKPDEEEDFGESASYFLSVIRKAARRLDRWDYDDANGPSRDRKAEREERQKAREMRLAMENSGDLAGRIPSSARSRARAARNAKRKLANAAANTPSAKDGGATGSSRSKANRSRSQRDAGDTVAATPDAAKDGLDVPSRSHELSPMPGSTHPGDEDEGDEGLDEIDRELLGEASGDDDGAPTPAARASRAAEAGYEDSFMEAGDADEDAEGLSSDDNDDEEVDDEDLDEGEAEADADENSSTLEGGNGYAASETSSVAGAEGDTLVADETMTDI
ncbi:putative INO80 chromatin remodeling complex (Ies1) [Aspergillus saccharolyticus JOP 1030-1]|uniref:INO80 chromatin remodeling complex n=1 Tax=Aspergillus saccharolyticus JOP 1030-1 TaxID=1450539 RepID=A0A318ZLW4_9EURO|nr:INO80 chromatin remodeling complex [Aspergillus saccharolyticus JOP 1030-1]PYH47434.1 INO80 chromatin remodeling complex [Aspergillus saccharolyticus JOP 1030-1]